MLMKGNQLANSEWNLIILGIVSVAERTFLLTRIIHYVRIAMAHGQDMAMKIIKNVFAINVEIRMILYQRLIRFAIHVITITRP